MPKLHNFFEPIDLSDFEVGWLGSNLACLVSRMAWYHIPPNVWKEQLLANCQCTNSGAIHFSLDGWHLAHIWMYIFHYVAFGIRPIGEVFGIGIRPIGMVCLYFEMLYLSFGVVYLVFGTKGRSLSVLLCLLPCYDLFLQCNGTWDTIFIKFWTCLRTILTRDALSAPQKASLTPAHRNGQNLQGAMGKFQD